ncbi:glycosyltransferase [Allomuricauda sp. SCSIO 65647]|uniref:glycosyltransferase n=1 Tax=Allomuricauda sp. SCSIO 65647 TaxID=2908843 RepID=UPI001F1F429C|nr:glycosyltransferase [Muricauda sp. SCSIO 65647]UJH67011.1 glycosyltransferase [Muricauda sp. SCSIO 65647]
MRLSIILPTYNMEKYLPRCLNSLLEQDIPKRDYEIIIVNDESKDNTLQIAKEYQRKYDNIVICDKENGGAGAARNSGLKMAKGKYIHFVDPDDYIARNVYGTLLHFAEEKELDIAAFIFTKTKRTDWFETNTNIEELNIDGAPVITGTEYIANNNYRNTVWWYLIDRKFIENTGLSFIEGRWMEDSILTPQLFMKAQRMARLPLDVYRYMITPNSAMTSKEPEHYHKLISDIENATFVFDGILKQIPENDSVSKKCKSRIKTRQQSFVFFLLVRLMKSRLPIQYIPEKLEGFKKINAYPLNNFVGKDFNGLGYRILTKIFNKEKLMYPFMHFFRGLYRPATKLIG